MTGEDSYREILTLLRSLEDRLTSTINTGLAAVNLAISTMQDQHNRALLDQEKRNATFAERIRVEDVAKHTHDTAGKLTTIIYRIGELERACNKHDQELASLDRRFDHEGEITTERGFKAVGQITQYLATFLMLIAIALLTYMLTHGGH